MTLKIKTEIWRILFSLLKNNDEPHYVNINNNFYGGVGPHILQNKKLMRGTVLYFCRFL